MTAPFRTRESSLPWPIHILTAIVAGFVALALDTPPSWSLAIWLAIVACVIAIDVASRRTIAIDREGFFVGSKHYAWSDVDAIKVREVPIARAGIFVKLTADARRRLRLGAPRHAYHGFGLEPAPSPADAAERFDVFIRAYRDRLEAIYALMSMRQLSTLTTQTEVLLAKASAGNVQARLVVDSLDALTVEVVATSLEALLADEGRAVAAVLPETARWDPSFQGGLMVLVGPMQLSQHPRADPSLDQYKQLVRKHLAGTPRAIEATFAARRS